MHGIRDDTVSILQAQESLAKKVRERLQAENVRAVNVMGAVGSGKTSLIEALIRLHPSTTVRFAAVAGDVAGEDDYRRFVALGIPAVAIQTRDDCHLDAHRLLHALDDLPLKDVDFLFVENVGNLVCPADFPLGCEQDMVVISVTEGDDMVRKHPKIFAKSRLLVLNKVNLAPHVGVQPERIIADYRRINPHGVAVLTDARSGAEIAALSRALGLTDGTSDA